jgi:hypothetical protein
LRLSSGGVLDRQRRRAAPLIPDGETLQEAQYDEENGRQDSYLLEGRQEPYDERRCAHDLPTSAASLANVL